MPESLTSSVWRERLSPVLVSTRRSVRKVRVAVEAGQAAARGVEVLRPGAPARTRSRLAMVEVFDARLVSGWVADEAQNLPVLITLHVNSVQVARTWAGEPSTHNTYSDIRAFHFELGDIWNYCKRADRVTVRIDGVPLPIADKGTYKRPARDGEFDLAELRAKLDAGYLFSQHGWLQLSKKLDTAWQAAVLGLYERVSSIVEREFGLDPFLVYGSLLGLVREDGFIGHDVDFDAAYLSPHTDPQLAAVELRDIALRLVDAGFDVECRRTALHISDVGEPSLRIDLFHLYFDTDDELQFPFGVVGRTAITRSQWRGVTDGQLAARTVRVPVDATGMVQHIYGPSWNVPIAGFNWDRERNRSAPAAWTRDEHREEVYWANFYARHELADPSSFFELVTARDDVPATVLDIGCGDGRDTFAFARHGSHAHGIDRSQLAVRRASDNAAAAGLGDRLTFETVDVSDATRVREAVGRVRTDGADGPILFYLRFFLHSISAEVQETLMNALAETSRDGDMIAAEFRADADADTVKVYGGHYRRYQDGFAFSRALHDRFGFGDIRFEQQDTGLAPFRDEDPVVYRVIAVREPTSLR